MKSVRKATWCLAAGLGSALCVAVAAQAQTATSTPAPATAENEVSAVTVTGAKDKPNRLIDRKEPPDAYAPKSSACEFLVATDPHVRELIERGVKPRIYLPTRPSLNPDYKAPPRSAPGSELPPAASTWKAMSTAKGNDYYTNTSIERALDICKSLQQRSQGQIDDARYKIARSDTTLQLGLALFNEGRYAEALPYFVKAHAKLTDIHGGDEAALMAGKISIFALGDPSNVAAGLVWLKKAAEIPFDRQVSTPIFDPDEPDRNTAIGEASLILARLYQTGYGSIAKDPAASRKWFQRAAYVGHVPAAKVLGDIYYLGAETPRDLKKAFKYYQEAATLAYAPAQYALGEMYLAGEHGGPPDLAKGLAWCNEAAKREHPEALYVMAQAYDTGEGLARDPARALGLYKIAALRGSRAAKTALGSYFYQGDILSRDPVLARRWFEQAATEGDADAMFNLGAMMMNGEGGAVDRTRAWVWLKIAQAGAHPGASAAVSVLEGRMTEQEKTAAVLLLTPRRAG